MRRGVSYYLGEIYTRTIHPILWTIRMYTCALKHTEKNIKKTVIFDTSIDTTNLGDEIIMEYCNYWLQDMGYHVSVKAAVQSTPKRNVLKEIVDYKDKFICGTNLLYPNMTIQRQWKFGHPFRAYSDICLLGVGWNSYSDKPINRISKYFYKHYLNKTKIHSVRDEYTKIKLESIGIKNVVNTACPTMWKLNAEFCKDIPIKKAQNVITTLTDNSPDMKNDKRMLEILLKNYNKVYLWLQGEEDKQYFDKMDIRGEITIVNRNLKDYDEMLKRDDIEYVGTRLHAGIRALNFKKRTTIIAVDNRAIEIARDTKLNIILREDVTEKLEKKINEEFVTRINLPEENIRLWKEQFKVQ